jgi:hypothetical protein
MLRPAASRAASGGVRQRPGSVLAAFQRPGSVPRGAPLRLQLTKLAR